MDWGFVRALEKRLAYLKWAKGECEEFYANEKTDVALTMYALTLRSSTNQRTISKSEVTSVNVVSVV